MPLLAHRIELIPNKAQAQFFIQNCGLARFAYNWGLNRWRAQHECRRKHLAWLCEEHGVVLFDGQRRRSLKQLLAELAQRGVHDPILPPAPSWQWISNQWTRHKEQQELAWVDDLSSEAPLQAIKHLGEAFKRFFDAMKKGLSPKVAGVPRRKKRDLNDSFTAIPGKGKAVLSASGVKSSRILGRKICLPKVGWVRMCEPLRFTGEVRQVTVSRRADKWFASILVDAQTKVSGSKRRKEAKSASPDRLVPLGENQAKVGVDLGIKHAVTLSSGDTFDSPNPLRLVLRQLKRAQRKLARMRTAALGKRSSKHDPVRQEHERKRRERRRQKYLAKLAKRKACSVQEVEKLHMEARKTKPAPIRGRCRLFEACNYQKQKLRVARLHYRVACQRQNWLHETTTAIVRRFGTICIEDLNVRGMMANDKLARSIADVGMHEFRRQLTYKSGLYGRTLKVADRFFPSSKRCSNCDWKNDELVLSERQWDCPQCKITHDRDVNAAKNLLLYGTGMYPGTDPEVSENTPAETGIRRRKRDFSAPSQSKKQESAGLTAEQGVVGRCLSAEYRRDHTTSSPMNGVVGRCLSAEYRDRHGCIPALQGVVGRCLSAEYRFSSPELEARSGSSSGAK